MILQSRWKSRINPKSAFLQAFRKDVTTQRGEDGIIEKIFEIVGATNRHCVEFGAWDGKLYSSTWNMLNNRDWHGLLIEANEAKFAELESAYRDNDQVAILNTLVEREGEAFLDAILTRAEAPADLDFLCIDVDGVDWHIWNSLTEFSPRLISIEFNPTVPNDIVFVQDDDAAINQGASLLALVELGKSKGYELVGTTAWNGFFVRNELYPAFGIEDNDIDVMHDTGPFESHLFQCYDGTLVLSGCRHLLWSDVTINQEDIQVLPKALRKFGGAVS